MTWSHPFGEWQGSVTQKPFLSLLFHAALAGACASMSRAINRNVKYDEKVQSVAQRERHCS